MGMFESLASALEAPPPPIQKYTVPNLVSVRYREEFTPSLASYTGMMPELGAEVIIDTASGADYAVVVNLTPLVVKACQLKNVRPLLRAAEVEDARRQTERLQHERSALEYCKGRAAERRLEMKLTRCEYAFDGKKALFYYTAEGRVDFRELVKDLAARLHVRIEMRQVGVRDEAKMVGGIGPCGRQLCCSSFLQSFDPVSINMARNQGLSLNPSKLSGLCGRLKCCLRYENGNYSDGKISACGSCG